MTTEVVIWVLFGFLEVYILAVQNKFSFIHRLNTFQRLLAFDKIDQDFLLLKILSFKVFNIKYEMLNVIKKCKYLTFRYFTIAFKSNIKLFECINLSQIYQHQ